MEYRRVQIAGGRGAAPEKFQGSLHGIAVDSHGRIYAAGDASVKVLEPSGALRRVLPLTKPALCVAVAPDGTTYAGGAGQIEIFDPAGKMVNAWRDAKLLARVTAIGFLRETVLVGEAGARCIHRLDRQGRLLNTIGKDNPLGGLMIPNGSVDFGVDGQGNIHVANPGKHRVERYSPDGALLGHIGKFNQHDPSGFTGCCNPTNVAIRDHIYVAEKASPRVKAYNFDGTFLGVIAAAGFNPNCRSMSLAVDSHGRVYVADPVDLTISVFEPVAGQPGEVRS